MATNKNPSLLQRIGHCIRSLTAGGPPHGRIMETILYNVDRSAKLLFPQHKLPEFDEAIQQKLHLTAPLRRIAMGAFGQVFQSAYHDADGVCRHIALKAIVIQNPSLKPADLAWQLDKFATKVRDEVNLLANLRHENIVRFIGSVELVPEAAAQPAAVIVGLEWMDCSLSELVFVELMEPLHVPRKLQHVYQLALQIGRALLYLHLQQICHHDIKPDNILVRVGPRPSYANMLSNGGNVFKLCDFGSAERYPFRSHDHNLLTINSHRGTRKYLAPERGASFQGGTVYNPYLLDSYAFGATMVTALVGKAAVGLVLSSANENLSSFWADQYWSLVGQYASASQQQNNAFDAIGRMLEPDMDKRAFIDEEWLKCFEN